MDHFNHYLEIILIDYLACICLMIHDAALLIDEFNAPCHNTDRQRTFTLMKLKE
jgi:hypothetical protein